MAYKMTIELSDRDLRHFRRELHKTRESVQIADDEDILTAAVDLVSAMRGTELPDFVAERLEKLETLLAMANDPKWPLEEKERSPILAGLAYLCDPEDLIPDDIPGIGMLDDAVMIELVFRELEHELEAYEDFRDYCEVMAKTKGIDQTILAARVDKRREQLMARMRRRKKKSVISPG
jgi:uncharacterized membrane protein YkvA (DUF1232 family)